jgi:cytoskeletal protein RodZ
MVDVAQLLKIRQSYLAAIEDGRFQDLPGPTYASGFVRSYGELLDLDVDDLVARYKAEESGAGGRTQLVFPTPEPEGRMPGAALLLIAVVLGGVAYGGWYYSSSTDRNLIDLLPEVPARWTAWLTGDDATDEAAQEAASTGLTAPVEETAPAGDAVADAGVGTVVDGTAAPTAPGTGDTAQGPSASGLEDGAAADVEAGTDRLSAVRMDTPSAAGDVGGPAGEEVAADPAAAGEEGAGEDAAPATVAGARDAVPPAGPAAAMAAPSEEATAPRIVLHATDMSWVQVRDSDGQLVMTRVLQPGERYEVPEGTGYRLDTGNAGALAVEVNGTRVESLGSDGEVRRDIRLEVDALTASAQ